MTSLIRKSLLALALCTAALLTSTTALAQQQTGYWASDGCFYVYAGNGQYYLQPAYCQSDLARALQAAQQAAAVQQQQQVFQNNSMTWQMGWQDPNKAAIANRIASPWTKSYCDPRYYICY